MVVNQDHYINKVFHEPGDHRLTVETFDSPYVAVAVRILVDPNDSADVKAVNALQDRLRIEAGSAQEFESTAYDQASLDEIRGRLLEQTRSVGDVTRAFGPRDTVDPERHLLGTAAGWGGLPDREARYLNVEPKLPVGEYRLTVRDVPVDAFWSITVYNAEGFMEPNDERRNSVNSVTAAADADGSVTVHFGGCGDGRGNCLPIMDGWNYIVRLYRPRAAILDGSWTFPSPEPA
jgi:hypothetical protein